MSLHTFTDGHIVLNLNDREIYNDIRARIDLTVTAVVTDSPDVYANGFKYYFIGSKVSPVEADLGAHETRSISLTRNTPPLQYSRLPLALTWTCATGVAFDAASNQIPLSVVITSSDADNITFEVTNPTGDVQDNCLITLNYSYLDQGATTHSESNTSTLQVLTSSPDSIAKYGRRVMDLVWPQGQTQDATIALAQAARDKYREPVPTATYTIQGKNAELVEQIFMRRISDLITIVQADIGLSADFFIDSVNISNSQGMANATWGLVMAREDGNN